MDQGLQLGAMSVHPAMDFDLKERVRLATDLVDVIGSQLPLRPQGRGYVASCPWHDDRRPSLQVNPQRQTWKCWVCDIGGDVFSYVMRRDGVDFIEALKILAEKAGIDYQPTGRRVAPGSPEDKSALLAAMKFAATAYFEFLDNDGGDECRRARDYLAERGIEESSRQLFQIGYAPDRWNWLLDEARRVGHGPEVLNAAGLVIPRQGGSGHYDRFRGRLMFPIWDLQDRPISLGGRILPGQDPDKAGAKYINGPETLLFSKSRQLYGLSLARSAMQKSGQVLVMEGYTDVIAARQAGIESVVAVLGTALGTHHIEILRRFVDRVVLVLDGDEAGRRRADQVLELFVAADVDLRVITLPGGADPADYLAQFGRQSFETLVRTAPDAMEHKLATLTEGIDALRDTHQATTALETILDLLSRSAEPDGLRTSQLLVRLSRTFAIPAEDLRRQLDRRIHANRRRPAAFVSSEPRAVPDVLRESPGEPILGIDRELFKLMIDHPEQAAQAVERIDPMWLANNTARRLLQAYQDLELEGRDLDLNTLLMSLDSESLKNQLVTLAEWSSRLETQPFEERFQVLLSWFHRQQDGLTQHREVNRIEQVSEDLDSATRLLGELIAARRLQHGLRPS